MSKITKNTVVISNFGPPCPRCQWPTQVREHINITSEELSKLYYFSQWYYCMNRSCRTKLIMPDEFKVFTDVKTEECPEYQKTQSGRAISQQLGICPWDED